jgi:hypothetical protein
MDTTTSHGTWRQADPTASRLRAALTAHDAPADLIARIRGSANIGGEGFVHVGSLPVEYAALLADAIEALTGGRPTA